MTKTKLDPVVPEADKAPAVAETSKPTKPVSNVVETKLPDGSVLVNYVAKVQK